MSDDVDDGREARDHPVELGAAGAADADREHDVAAERDRRERERPDDARCALELRRRQPGDEPGREQGQSRRDPGADDDEVGEHPGVGLLGFVVALDRVGERRPRGPERGQQEHHRRRDRGRRPSRGRPRTCRSA